MNKQDVIMKAYGKRYEVLKDEINENGVFVGDTDCITNKEFYEWDFVASTTPLNVGKLVSGSRPKSLLGIETNNSWIKIESEADLPNNSSALIWVYTDKGNIYNYFFYSTWFSINELEKVTHYQPITKPLKPIY